MGQIPVRAPQETCKRRWNGRFRCLRDGYVAYHHTDRPDIAERIQSSLQRFGYQTDRKWRQTNVMAAIPTDKEDQQRRPAHRRFGSSSRPYQSQRYLRSFCIWLSKYLFSIRPERRSYRRYRPEQLWRQLGNMGTQPAKSTGKGCRESICHHSRENRWLTTVFLFRGHVSPDRKLHRR